MKQFNFIFYLIIFLGFLLPSNSNFYFTLTGVKLQIRELAFLLLPLVNLFCLSNNRVWVADRKLKMLIGWFLMFIVVTELCKHLYYGENLGNVVKTIRIGLPLFSSLILVFIGIRTDIEKVWRTLLWAISFSAVLTLFSPFVYLPIYPSIEGDNILEATQGRLMNSNSSFGIVGIYLLYKDKEQWYNKGSLPMLTSLLSIAVLILSFNRTYLALLALAFIYLTFTEFSFRRAFKIISIPALALGIFWAAYNYSEVIQRQVDKRIIDVILGTTLLSESVYENNREYIIESAIGRIEEGYWAFGLPYNKYIFYIISIDGTIYNATKTDISLINVLLRYGIIPFLTLLLIYLHMFNKGTSFLKFTLLLFLISSLNIDSLLAHNSILFLAFVFFVVNYRRL